MSKQVNIKVKPILGALPDDTSWWTEKQWEDHKKYVEKLKEEGRYLSEGEEISINIRSYPEFENKNMNDFGGCKNFGLFIPENCKLKNK